MGSACDRCDELLSPHHGSITAARHTTWPLQVVVQALNDLSLGESYGNASLAMRRRRDAARDHLQHEHGIVAFTPILQSETPPSVAPTDADPVPEAEPGKSAEDTSASRTDRRNAWRAAADVVEQYSPPLFARLDHRYRTEAAARRTRNDALIASRGLSEVRHPIVYVLDELPVWGKAVKGQPRRPQWNVLTVVEVLWRLSSDPTASPQRESRLRLARAFPRANSDAWRLVLDELAVRPDFVVADYGQGIQKAVAMAYHGEVGVVPSLWHLHRNLRDALLKLDNTYFLDGDERVLVDPLRKHMSRLARDEIIGRTAHDIAEWFDELETIVAALPAPLSSVQAQRHIHQPRLIEALPILNANPHVPASNAVVENRIRMALKPFLQNRAHMFGNVERTNRLLNLLVCREGGVFDDLDSLSMWIRQLNESNGGWAPEPRQIVDKQPAGAAKRARRYESLKSHSVITKLSRGKGIATAVEVEAQAPPATFSRQRPETKERLPIREWARSVGLPGPPTGPIKAAVKEAYELYVAGATVEEARAAYTRAEDARHAAQRAARKERWSQEAEKSKRAELAPLRAWAKENGIDLPRNGFIPPNVRQQFEEHQQGVGRQRRPSQQLGRGET